VAGLVFMLCFTSFATVMALGGGPKATTIELAIYQAIKFDFDLQSGALLALWQILLCASLSLFIQGFAKPLPVVAQGMKEKLALFRDSRQARWWDKSILVVSLLLILPPLFAVVLGGINSKLFDVLTQAHLWHALANSLRVALAASVLALVCGIAILTTSRAWRLVQANRKADLIELSGTMILVTPGLVVSTGLFLLLRSYTDVFSLAYWIVVWVNALMGLPYVIKTLHQPMWLLAKQYQQLSISLGLTGWQRWCIVEWRAMKKPLAHAFVVSFLVAMGDLSAIALFGSQDFQTLPLYLYRLLGSYQMEAAAVVSLLMLSICLGCFYIADKLFHIGEEN
jgi:thiamine transport system permease protein